jgi:hypothetical protein
MKQSLKARISVARHQQSEANCNAPDVKPRRFSQVQRARRRSLIKSMAGAVSNMLARATSKESNSSAPATTEDSEKAAEEEETAIELIDHSSIHLYAIAVVTSPRRVRHALGVALLSLGIVALQLALLTLMLIEVSHPSCYESTSCFRGQYCSHVTLRCEDCLEIYYSLARHGLNASFCSQLLGSVTLPTGQELAPFDKDMSPWDDVDATKLNPSDPALNFAVPATLQVSTHWLQRATSSRDADARALIAPSGGLPTMEAAVVTLMRVL